MVNPDNRKKNSNSAGAKDKNPKDSVTSKKDVDEFDLDTEYFTNLKNESDGEDF